MTKTEYESQYGLTVCESTKQNYSETGNYDWINREKEKGNDLTEYREKLGKAISAGVMNSDSARKARKDNLTALNKTASFRKKSSETAIKTSARKDILETRTKQLSKWRKNNPEDFYDKCIANMTSSFQSIPEKELFRIIHEDHQQFKRGQKLKRTGMFLSTKSNIRQIDIMSLDDNIIVEYDGVHHFKNIFKDETLSAVRKKDNELNSVMVSEGWTVIRVGSDQYSYKRNGGFSEELILAVKKIIVEKKRGLFLMGDIYAT